MRIFGISPRPDALHLPRVGTSSVHRIERARSIAQHPSMSRRAAATAGARRVGVSAETGPLVPLQAIASWLVLGAIGWGVLIGVGMLVLRVVF